MLETHTVIPTCIQFKEHPMSEMKALMERWDTYLIFENENLENVKDNPQAVKSLGNELVKANKDKLQGFLDIVSNDPEIMDLVKSFEEMSNLIDQDLQEGILDQLGATAYVKAEKFFKTDLGQKIKTYGAPAAALAYMAFQMTQGTGDIDPEIMKDAFEVLAKGKNLSAADVVGQLAGLETGLTEQDN